MPPREKFSKRGIESLSEEDLISVIIGSGIKDIPYKKIARHILLRLKVSNGSLDLDEIASIQGIGYTKAMRVLAGIELGKRLIESSSSGGVKILNTTDAVNQFLEISTKKREYAMALYINARFEIIKKEFITIGSFNVNRLLPRDVIIPALECNAYGIVLGHNHPSGDSTPSQEDINLTKRLMDACKIVDLKLLDHIVVAGGEWKGVPI